jgi:demethylmenaquinone methyltransferase/2-methoxy-6-polyprenyl-1,4-benzoquinol methylase
VTGDATAQTIRQLLGAEPLRAPVARAMIDALGLPPGSAGLDVGCGIGLQATVLAEAVGPAGRVTGLDIDPGLVAVASARAEAGGAAGAAGGDAAGAAGAVTFRTGDMGALPFADGTFDWAWSLDCAGYPAGDLAGPLAEMARVVRPGGTVAIAGWTSQSLLPGHEALEARLEGTCSAYAPHLAAWPAADHFDRAPDRFREAGLRDVETRAFAGEVRAPLPAGVREALASLVGMLWVEPDGGSPDMVALREVLAGVPGGAPPLLDDPAYHASFACTLTRGTVPGA